MKSSPRADVAAIILDGTATERAIVAARRRVVKTHQRLGMPLVIWRDGHVVELAPESVDLSELDRDDAEVGRRVADQPTLEEMRERLGRLSRVTTKESAAAAVRAERDSR